MEIATDTVGTWDGTGTATARGLDQVISATITRDLISHTCYVRFREDTGGQASREPQPGPGKHYRGALSPPHSICLEIEASRGRKRVERCPLTIRLGVQRSVVSSPSRVRGSGSPAENGFYAYFRSERSHLEHHLQ